MAFTAIVTDVFSQDRGWRTMNRMPTDLPLGALEMALWVRDRADEDVTGVIQHSVAGAQYTAIRYAERLACVGAIASIRTIGDSHDNAPAETVVGLYKTECVKIDDPFRTADETRTRHALLGALAQREPPALIGRIPHTAREEERVLP